MKVFAPLATALMALAGSASAAVIYSTDFETDQSANFTRVEAFTTVADSQADFNYSYNTHAQLSGSVFSIPEAPNSALGATKGLRISSNVSDSTAELAAVSLYYHLGSTLTEYKLKFDVWGNFNGDNKSGTGSTNMFFYGAAATQTVPFSTPTTAAIPGNGFIFTLTPDGGAAGDFRLYSGTSTIARNDAAANYLGANKLDDLDPEWQAVFPAISPLVVAGAPGKRWNTVEMIVRASAPNIQVFITPPGGPRTLVSEIAVAPAATNFPVIGYSDINGGIANPASDQFAVIDNFSIDDNPSAGLQDWALY